jgi:serine/threonine-protein kinase HipA
MREYIVSIEKNGDQIIVGSIIGTDVSDASFVYDDKYLNSDDPVAISISLPLQKEPFSSKQTRIFFDGLLPEGFTRRSVAQWLHFDEDDYLSILHGLGKECLGAIRVTLAGEEDEEFYEEIDEEQIRKLAAEGATKSTEIVTGTHLSLAGASGKVGLYHTPTDTKWYLPHGLAPSTHIVKQSHVRLDGIVTNEQLSMLTAAKCGINTAESFIINTGNGNDSEVLFVTKRYDRLINSNSKTLNGLERPFRLHQEDFAQAMGIPSANKYEPEGAEYALGMFEVLRRYSSDPLADMISLWDRIVFSYILGNNDGHIKNYSLLRGINLKEIRLAPAYDIICTTVYGNSTRKMSFNIGGKTDINDISESSFRELASSVGLGEKIAIDRFGMVLNHFESSLRASAKELKDLGFIGAESMADKILISRKNVFI